jgi:hypothetical protein
LGHILRIILRLAIVRGNLVLPRMPRIFGQNGSRAVQRFQLPRKAELRSCKELNEASIGLVLGHLDAKDRGPIHPATPPTSMVAPLLVMAHDCAGRSSPALQCSSSRDALSVPHGAPRRTLRRDDGRGRRLAAGRRKRRQPGLRSARRSGHNPDIAPPQWWRASTGQVVWHFQTFIAKFVCNVR